MSGLDLQDCASVVTGAASGIGAAVVDKLVAEGCSVVAVDIDRDRLAERHHDAGEAVMPWGVDVGEDGALDQAIASCIDRFGRFDHLLNNAGIVGPIVSFRDYATDDFDRLVRVNVRGTFLGIRAALRAFAQQETGGSIVSIASISGVRPSPTAPIYSGSKHAVVGLTTSACSEAASYGVRVNAIAPGRVDTPIIDTVANADARETAQAKAALGSLAALGRLGDPGEIADVVAWLFSSQSSYVTGTVITADGGALAL